MVPPLVCHGVRIYCEADYINRLSLCLPTWVVPSTSAPLDSRNMSYFQTRLASLPSLHFFHSSPKPVSLLGSLYLGQRCAVNGVLRQTPDRPEAPPTNPTPLPHRYSAHTRLQHLFQMWLFLTPCAISLPDLPPISESVWLARQFHRISHAKSDPREGEPDSLAPRLLLRVAPLRALI